MDESVNIVFSNRLSDALRTVNVDVLVGEVPIYVRPRRDIVVWEPVLCRILATNKVVDNVGMANTLFN